MRIYVDSAERDAIRAALAMGWVWGVTTNPTLLRRAGVRTGDVPGLVRDALAAGARELHLQTYSDDAAGMVAEGRELAALDPVRRRVVVKIPATAAGYVAARQLVARGLRVTLTAVYTVRQAILADAVGAAYVAVYLGRVRDAGDDPLALVGAMQQALAAAGSGMAILAASVRDGTEIEALAPLGIATVTLPPAVLHTLLDSPATAAAATTFLDDARAIR
ncbi:MAG: transaldolase [Chloroflexota bacterium]|nr:transaldolase [Chloroflexota bacterium]